MNSYYINAQNGMGNYELSSFDSALRNAHFGNYNLVKVSSILPPNAKKCTCINVKEGEALYVAYASITEKSSQKKIAAAVGVGIPENKENVGVIMEFSGHCDKLEAEKQVKNMIMEAFAGRKYTLKSIQIRSTECETENSVYKTAFAGIAIW